MPSIFGFYSVLYYLDYIFIFYNIFLISGFIYMRDTKEFAQITSLSYLIILPHCTVEAVATKTEQGWKEGKLHYFILLSQMSKFIYYF